MKEFENETHKMRLERIIRTEIVPQLQLLSVTLDEKLVEALYQSFKLHTVSKDQYIDEGGSAEDGKLLYMKSGIARTFYYDQAQEKQVITRIWKKREVIFDANSFISGKDRTEIIQMLEDGELLSVSYSKLKYLSDAFPKVNFYLLHLHAERENYNKSYQHLLKLNVEARVRVYLDRNPGITNRLNNDHIATHLGMSRSRFSKAHTVYKQETYASS